MKSQGSPAPSIRSAFIWIAATFTIGSYLFFTISSAFLQESRTSSVSSPNINKPRGCRRREGRSRSSARTTTIMDLRLLLLLLPEQEEDRTIITRIRRDTTSSASTTKRRTSATITKMHMVGPLFDDDECGLVGGAGSSSFGGGGIMADCEALPAMAHGILCPETVTKMAEKNNQGGGRSSNNKAVKVFLDRYRRYGPMSCMDLLSDPEILPHLTMAMRDLA